MKWCVMWYVNLNNANQLHFIPYEICTDISHTVSPVWTVARIGGAALPAGGQ